LRAGRNLNGSGPRADERGEHDASELDGEVGHGLGGIQSQESIHHHERHPRADQQATGGTEGLR